MSVFFRYPLTLSIQFPRADGIDSLRIAALLKVQDDDIEAANNLFAEASAALMALEQSFADVEHRDLEDGLSKTTGTLLPFLAAKVWRHQSTLIPHYGYNQSH